MKFISDYILLFVIAIILIVGTIIYIKDLSKDKKISALKEWLKWAVVEAEKALGSGTGQIKLRMVYDMAIKKFPWLIMLVSFEMFSKLVDEALDWVENQLSMKEETNHVIEEEQRTE